MSKFVKILVIINGLLLPTILCFVLYEISGNFFKKKPTYIVEEGIIVGERLDEAQEKNISLQGLHYDKPEPIYNSLNYCLPVSVMTYKEAKSLKNAIGSAGEIGYGLRQVMNVVFLDTNYNVITTLLNKKASIGDMKLDGWRYFDEKKDKNKKRFNHLIFKIGYEDTNNDGKLNTEDSHDLYISDLTGNNLTQISHNVDIVSFEYALDYSQINIVYQERTNERKEHKRNKFAYFDMESKTWLEHDDLNQKLNDLEVLLIN